MTSTNPASSSSQSPELFKILDTQHETNNGVTTLTQKVVINGENYTITVKTKGDNKKAQTLLDNQIDNIQILALRYLNDETTSLTFHPKNSAFKRELKVTDNNNEKQAKKNAEKQIDFSDKNQLKISLKDAISKTQAKINNLSNGDEKKRLENKKQRIELALQFLDKPKKKTDEGLELFMGDADASIGVARTPVENKPGFFDNVKRTFKKIIGKDPDPKNQTDEQSPVSTTTPSVPANPPPLPANPPPLPTNPPPAPKKPTTSPPSKLSSNLLPPTSPLVPKEAASPATAQPSSNMPPLPSLAPPPSLNTPTAPAIEPFQTLPSFLPQREKDDDTIPEAFREKISEKEKSAPE